MDQDSAAGRIRTASACVLPPSLRTPMVRKAARALSGRSDGEDLCRHTAVTRVSRVVPESIVFETQPDVASPIEEPDTQDAATAAAAAGTAESSSTSRRRADNRISRRPVS